MLLRWTTGVYLWAALVLALLAAGADQPILPVVGAALVGRPASRRTPCGVAVAGEAAA